MSLLSTEREKEREREMNLLPPLPLKEEFSLYQKYWDLLDYREKVDKSDIKKFSLESIMYKGCFPNEILVGRKL